MSETIATWRDGYAALANLWCSPADVDPAETHRQAELLLAELERVDVEAAGSLAGFLQQPISEEEYVELFELDPRCPLYLGSHSFDEPKTCAQAGVSDRNGYMIEILGVYRHLGLITSGNELADYLPLMLEFLSLTAESDDPVREKLVREYMLPYLPPLAARLEALKSPYRQLLDATERVMRLDVGPDATGERHA